MPNTQRTPVSRSEDWWACFIGWFIVLVSLIGQSQLKLDDEIRAKIDDGQQKVAVAQAELGTAEASGDEAAIQSAAGKLTRAEDKVLGVEKKWRARKGFLPVLPKIGKWEGLDQIFGDGWILQLAAIFIFLLVLFLIAGIWLKFEWKRFVFGFLVIFALALLAEIIANQKWIKTELQFSAVIFALVFGLLISNLLKVPKWLAAARQTEFYVKVGLVAMGAGILFGDVIRAGVWGMLQAVLVAVPVWFMTYWICRRFRIAERFSAIIASANSICGVSATIAAGGAIQGKPKEVSYMVAWVLVCAVVLIVVMPPIAVALGLTPAWAGAWVGGVIDNTGAVVAAGGAIAEKHGAGAGDVAVTVASIVKMAQNVLIGIAAFFMALWATMSLEKKEAGADYVKPGFGEVWYRFPKFVVGFIVASLVISLFDPLIGTGAVKGIGAECKVYRDLLFGLCFVSIGLETNFKELISVGGGRPAAAYWIAQIANAFWTLFITWILWSGSVFHSPF